MWLNRLTLVLPGVKNILCFRGSYGCTVSRKPKFKYQIIYCVYLCHTRRIVIFLDLITLWSFEFQDEKVAMQCQVMTPYMVLKTMLVRNEMGRTQDQKQEKRRKKETWRRRGRRRERKNFEKVLRTGFTRKKMSRRTEEHEECRRKMVKVFGGNQTT